LLRDLWPDAPRDLGEAALRLAAAVAVGAAIHLLVQGALWRLAGAPAGPERMLLRLAEAAADRLRGRAA
jgi:hypothetical protein